MDADRIVECPKCKTKVMADWDYQFDGEDEYPFVCDLLIVQSFFPG